MEVVLESKCLDIYRLKDGVLFKVYKCRFIDSVSLRFSKRVHEKIAENIYVTKEEFKLNSLRNNNCIVPVCSHIVENYWVEPLYHYSEFRFELKTTSNSFSGYIDDINKYISDINTIMKKYIDM